MEYVELFQNDNIPDEQIYDLVLTDAISRVPEKYSTSQDSPVFNGVAPACYEVADTLKIMRKNLKQSFGVTATGIYLDNLAKEIGLDRFKATYSLKKAEFKNSDEVNIDVPIGSRFAKDEYTFTVTKKLETGIYEILSEQAGSVTNSIVGDITAIDNLPVDIASAKILSTVQQAVDDETDEQLRSRYLQKVREPATSGNIYHYKRWALEVEGVGNSKIFPLYNGNGTVKVMIVTTDFAPADEGLIKKVAAHIQTLRPIGATVTVTTAKLKDISITAQIVTTPNANFELITQEFKEKLKQYFKEAIQLNFIDTKTLNYVISLAQIGRVLLETTNILDYMSLKLNDSTNNIVFQAEEIPNILSVNFTKYQGV